ncbi:hypothetical protein OPQ81_000829 [Rhizoctonia solani]|nr:hypothetical protein OPQ81_000829 [Rhizoctonia solani]
MILSLHNFTEAERLERLRSSGAAPVSNISVRFRTGKLGALDTYADNPEKSGSARGDIGTLGIDTEVASFEVVGRVDDNFRGIEMRVLSTRGGDTNV